MPTTPKNNNNVNDTVIERFYNAENEKQTLFSTCVISVSNASKNRYNECNYRHEVNISSVPLYLSPGFI